MKIISVRLPDELHEALTKLAADKERSLNQQIVYLLRRAVAIDTPQKPEESS